MNRRDFVKASTAGLAAVSSGGALQAEVHSGGRPAVISSKNGLRATGKAMEMLRQGADTLEAVVAGVNIVEEDPSDQSVGYGGLPNDEGVVQLDASVMHGPTHGAGSVAALEGIKTPSKVAKLVMERTDHVLLVGEGALKFALAMGFREENLLTDESREMWLKWKRELSPEDDWIDPSDRLPRSVTAQEKRQFQKVLSTYGTINCNAVDENGDISGVTTTSGLSYKIPGRVGDSPIIGAGLYVDNEVGACGSTGRGEANLKSCASFMVVEFMRQGLSPEEAGLRVLKRIAENTVEPYLLDEKGRPNFGLLFYAINKKGEFAGVSLWGGRQYAAHDGKVNRLYDAASLYNEVLDA
ncbi:MAG: N(4)-(beta-N-acetylglucosaminyl)-L-asparaginase [Acidobacteriota bacterium]|nr:MAG: N(4)-(beta-N-acetylglucosaminyl)-L-asparaginase [Acidobacteriota bacterium]